MAARPTRRGRCAFWTRLRADAAGSNRRWLNAPFLYKDGEIDPQFVNLDKPLGVSDLKDERAVLKETLFAFGGDRVNSAPHVAMINTLFLREHNRLAALLEHAHAHWDDDRVFETARNTVIVLFIKVVIEDYIDHIAPLPFRLRADTTVSWRADWSRTNWITTEFSLLYRWHSLIPDEIEWNGVKTPIPTTFMNNRPLLEAGLRGHQRPGGGRAWPVQHQCGAPEGRTRLYRTGTCDGASGVSRLSPICLALQTVELSGSLLQSGGDRDS